MVLSIISVYELYIFYFFYQFIMIVLFLFYVLLRIEIIYYDIESIIYISTLVLPFIFLIKGKQYINKEIINNSIVKKDNLSIQIKENECK